MAYRVTDDCEPEGIPYNRWEECEKRGDYALTGRHIETDENHTEVDDDETL